MSVADDKRDIEDEGRTLVRMCQDLRMRVNELEERIDRNLDRYLKTLESEKDVSSTD